MTRSDRFGQRLSALPIPLVAVLWLVGLPQAVAAQTTTVTDVDTDIDTGPLTGIAMSAAPHAQIMLGGEAFESLERGVGASVAVSAYFAERYALRGRFSATTNAEGSSLYDDRTTTLEAWLELRWVRSLMGLQFEAGPTVGYARLSRPMYLESINGFLVGLGVGAERALVAGFRIVLGVDVTLASFNAPPIAFPSPPGWDDDADGDRLSISLGLAYRWPRG